MYDVIKYDAIGLEGTRDNVWPRDAQGDSVSWGVEKREWPGVVSVEIPAGESWLTAVVLLRKIADQIERDGLPLEIVRRGEYGPS